MDVILVSIIAIFVLIVIYIYINNSKVTPVTLPPPTPTPTPPPTPPPTQTTPPPDQPSTPTPPPDTPTTPTPPPATPPPVTPPPSTPTPPPPVTSSVIMPNGKGQYIKYIPDPSYCLDLGNGDVNMSWLQIYKCFGTDQMKWDIPSGSGQIKYHKNPAYCLSATPALGKTGGASLAVASCRNEPGQIWTYNPTDGSICAAGYCLNNQNFTKANGNNVQAYPKSGTAAQKWKLSNTP